jgi:hypothetical protein
MKASTQAILWLMLRRPRIFIAGFRQKRRFA